MSWVEAPQDSEVGPTLRAAFLDRYGVEPAGVWAAPGRVNLIGEHTDYNDGLCLPMALPHKTFAAVALRDDDRLRLVSLQDPVDWEGPIEGIGPGSPKGWAGYAAGVVWALRERGLTVPGLDVLVDGRVPVGAGLSSSAALSGSVAVALADLVPEVAALGRPGLAQACVQAENEIVGAATGGMDQAAALLSRPGHLLLLDYQDGSRTHVPWPENAPTLLVVDTRAPHVLADGQYAARRAACATAARALGVSALRQIDPGALESALSRVGPELAPRVRHVVTEIDRVSRVVAAVRAEDFAQVGRLMQASHASLRDDYEVSSPGLDTAVDAAVAAGAVGARMTGGGFGGSAVVLVAHEALDEVVDQIGEAFADRGLAEPGLLLVGPSGPAGRVSDRVEP